MSNKKFLISHEPGARGDFLAAILVDQFCNRDQNCHRVLGPEKNYVKLHPLPTHIWTHPTINNLTNFPTQFESYEKVFEICKNSNITTIRIHIQDFNDAMDVAYFNFYKNYNFYKNNEKTRHMHVNHIITDNWHDTPLFFADGVTLIQDHLRTKFETGKIWDETPDYDYYNCYDHLIPFKKLFDIEYIQDFYFKIHDKKLPDDSVVKIIKNISIHQRWGQKDSA